MGCVLTPLTYGRLRSCGASPGAPRPALRPSGPEEPPALASVGHHSHASVSAAHLPVPPQQQVLVGQIQITVGDCLISRASSTETSKTDERLRWGFPRAFQRYLDGLLTLTGSQFTPRNRPILGTHMRQLGLSLEPRGGYRAMCGRSKPLAGRASGLVPPRGAKPKGPDDA